MPKFCFRILVLLVILTPLMCRAKSYTIVIDPGHGGKDFGAVGKITNEKTINLDVALLAGRMIKKAHPDVNIIYTRKDDRYISLKERADIANDAHGDLFISIHVNSVAKSNRKRTTIKGTSVYTLGLHKSAANFEVAKRENSVISLDSDFATRYEGFDPSSAESYIMFELGQNRHIGQSVRFAQHVQSNLIKTAGRADNSVRQAGFWVLWATGMPSVLIELDFICNPQIEKYLASDKGKRAMAQSISDAFTEYRGGKVSHTPTDESIDDTTDTIDTSEPDREEPTPAAETKNKSKSSSKRTYHVQILASATPVRDNAPDFKGRHPGCFRDGKWHKYYIGDCATMAEAKKILKEVIKDFPGAFIIELDDTKQLSKKH